MVRLGRRLECLLALFGWWIACGGEDGQIVYELLNFTLAPAGRHGRGLRWLFWSGGNWPQLIRAFTPRLLPARKRINKANSFHTTSPKAFPCVDSNGLT
jgi:hypothetical protein